MSDFEEMHELMAQRAADIWARKRQPLVMATTPRQGYRQMFSTSYADAPMFGFDFGKMRLDWGDDSKQQEDDMPNIFKCDECGEIVDRKTIIVVDMKAQRARAINKDYDEIPRVAIESGREVCDKCLAPLIAGWPYPYKDYAENDDDE